MKLFHQFNDYCHISYHGSILHQSYVFVKRIVQSDITIVAPYSAENMLFEVLWIATTE